MMMWKRIGRFLSYRVYEQQEYREPAGTAPGRDALPPIYYLFLIIVAFSSKYVILFSFTLV